MIEESYLQRVFRILQENYSLVPLEIFGSDPYKTLISTIMSARTNDDTTLAASNRLFEVAPNIARLAKLSEKEISELIFPVGFYKTKAKHLQKTAQIILKQYNGQIPATREELVKLPGVGRKTANLVLNRAYGIPAIAVDTHVHRITNILGWVQTSTPVQTEADLMQVIPQKYWFEMNKLFVSLGRRYRSNKRLNEFIEINKLKLTV